HPLHALLGEVGSGRGVVHRADNHIIHLAVGVQHAIVELRLEKPEIGRFGHIANRRAGKFRLELLLHRGDLSGSGVGLRVLGRHRQCKRQQKTDGWQMTQNRTQNDSHYDDSGYRGGDWTVYRSAGCASSLFSGPRLPTRLMPRLRSAPTHGDWLPYKRTNPSATPCIANTGATRRLA